MLSFRLFLFLILTPCCATQSTLFAGETSPMKWSEFTFLLKPSPVGGVGVFTAHDITAGTELLPVTFNVRTMKIKDIPQAFVSYCIFINDEECLCPENFNRMEIGWYINHSDTPNMAITNPAQSASLVPSIVTNSFYALRDIKEGEEVFVNYNALGEPESMKEDYYKKS